MARVINERLVERMQILREEVEAFEIRLKLAQKEQEWLHRQLREKRLLLLEMERL